MKSKIALFLKLAFACIMLFLVFRKINLSAVINTIEGINPLFFIIAVLSSALSLMISGLRSQYYFKAYGLVISKFYMIKLYFIGTFFNLALPGGIGGDGYKVYHINKAFGFGKFKALRVILYERINGFYILCLLGFFTFYFSSFNSIPYANFLNISLLALITPCYILGIKYILKDKLTTAYNASWYSLLVQLLQMLLTISLLYGLAPEAEMKTYLNFTLLFIVASIIAIVPISIGGIGIRELTFLYGLEFLDNSLNLTTLGIAFALASFMAYALSALIGLLFYLRLKNVKLNE